MAWKLSCRLCGICGLSLAVVLGEEREHTHVEERVDHTHPVQQHRGGRHVGGLHHLRAMIDPGADGIIEYLRSTAAEVRPYIVSAAHRVWNSVPIRMVLTDDHDRDEDGHPIGTRALALYNTSLFNTVTTAGSGSNVSLFVVYLPQTESGTHVSHEINEGLTQVSRIEVWIPPTVR
jgi:hypothetical protein